MQNQPETQPVNSRKKRRLIFLAAGSLILLAAVSVSIICSLRVSSAIADGRNLLSDPDKFPDTSALTEAKAKLDKVNSKYGFAFARWRTEGIRKQLEAAGIVVSVIAEGESILRNGQSDKFQEAIDKLKQSAAKYPFPFAKRRSENLIKQLETAKMVASVLDEGESILQSRQYDKFQETIAKLKQNAAQYPFPFAKRRTEDLIKQLETAKMLTSIMDECESILHDGRSDKFQEAIDKLKQTAAQYPFPFVKRRTEDLIKQLEAAGIVVSVIAEGESILRNRQYDKFQDIIAKLKQNAAQYPFPFAKRRTENLLNQLNQFQQIIVKKISEGLEKLKAAQTAEEMLQIYRSIIASCPANAPELKPVWKSYRDASSQYVNRMIELAEKSNNYNDALTYLKRAVKNCPDAPNIDNARNLYYRFLREYVNRLIEAAEKSNNYNDALRYLKDAMDYYPDAPNITTARNLYYRYLREIEQKRQAQRARQNQMQTCPACRGSGQVSQTGFTPGHYQAAILGTTTCSTCSGTGAVRRNANVRLCPACGGRKSTRDIFTGRSIQCRNCDGSGYVTFSD